MKAWLCLALLLPWSLNGLAALPSESLSRPDKPWRLVEAEAYTAKVYGSGRLDIAMPGCSAMTLSFLQCWSVEQTGRDVRNVTGRSSLADDALSARIELSYSWNEGEVQETLDFTSRSLAVNYEYRSPKGKAVNWFACYLCLDNAPELAGGLYRFDERKGMLEPSRDWKSFANMRFSSLFLRAPWKTYVDVIAEGDAWFDTTVWGERRQIFLWPRNRFKAQPLPAGTPLKLGMTLWLHRPDGGNLPAEEFHMIPCE